MALTGSVLAAITGGRLFESTGAQFVVAWTSILVLVVIWTLRRARVSPGEIYAPTGSGVGRLLPAGSEWIWVGLFASFAAFYVFLIFYREDFADYDNYELTNFSLRGRHFPLPIYPSAGRFFPLAYQEFELVRLFTRSIVGYHMVGVANLLVVLGAVYYILRNLEVRTRLFAMTLVMITPSFLVSFLGLLATERDIVVLLAVFILCVEGYLRTKSRWFLAGSLVAAQCAIYFKETVFIIILAFAGIRLAYGWLSEREDRGGLKTIFRNRALEGGLIALAGLFLALYVAFVANANLRYASDLQQTGRLGSESHASVLFAFLRTDVLVSILGLVWLVRMVAVARGKATVDPVWDALALGALLYASAFVLLRMYSPYYTAPSDFVAILYVARLSGSQWFRNRPKLVGAMAGVVALILASYSFYHLLERKNRIGAEIELAGFLDSYLQRHRGASVPLYFPYTDGFRLMELGAYFDYRGLPVSRADRVEGGPHLVFESPGQFELGRCFDSRWPACSHLDSPSPGALMVVLPDDVVPARDREAGLVPLFVREPQAVSRWTRPLLSAVHRSSSLGFRESLPEDWMTLRVMKTP